MNEKVLNQGEYEVKLRVNFLSTNYQLKFNIRGVTLQGNIPQSQPGYLKCCTLTTAMSECS